MGWVYDRSVDSSVLLIIDLDYFGKIVELLAVQ